MAPLEMFKLLSIGSSTMEGAEPMAPVQHRE